MIFKINFKVFKSDVKHFQNKFFDIRCYKTNYLDSYNGNNFVARMYKFYIFIGMYRIIGEVHREKKIKKLR